MFKMCNENKGYRHLILYIQQNGNHVLRPSKQAALKAT